MGNRGYKLIKLLEPTCVGIHLDKYDTLSISHNFFKELKQQQDTDEDRDYLMELYNLIYQNSPTPVQIFEFFGCYRHFGHPTVDEEGGCNTMKEQTRKEVDIDQEAANQITGAWNRFFILNFITKHNRWPLCETTLPDTSKLHKMITNGIVHLDEFASQLTLEDWAIITFDQEFEFDYFPDFLELLSDKSLSPYLLNWVKVYSRDLHNVIDTGTMKESRRVLMEILSRRDLSIELICKTIGGRRVPDHWKVVGLHAKERELKIKARLFAMMVLEMRLYFCSTEANIARTIFQYLPCQTMTWSETELLRHIHHVTQPDENQLFIPITISLDFEKWNNRWRDAAVRPIFKNLDNLLGCDNLFTYSHEFFESSYFYLSSHLHPPEQIVKHNNKERRDVNPLDSWIPLGLDNQVVVKA